MLIDTTPEKATIYTSILEIDGETRHPKNKRIVFGRANAPVEYDQICQWAAELTGAPTTNQPTINEQAAMALAEEATHELTKAKKEIEQLQTQLHTIRSALGA